MDNDTLTPVGTRFVKKTEVARALGVSPRTVDDWIAKRMIPFVAVSPRLHLFDIGEVKAALRERFGVGAAGR